ncbi:MAG: outer membrane protein/peptidoglycan-associated protein [Acidobacteria bacterium]|nr:outer membrane protein/peptidoglycan-associated protein [Acidobacteriota bacterium]
MFRKRILVLLSSLMVLMLLGVFENLSVAGSTSELPQQAQPVKFDEFGDVRWNDLKARLDNFTIELQTRSDVKAYVIFYASGKCSRPGEAANLAHNAESYLTNARGLPGSRIKAINGGFRETRFWELWILPSGAVVPTATPSVPRKRARISNKCPALPRNTM